MRNFNNVPLMFLVDNYSYELKVSNKEIIITGIDEDNTLVQKLKLKTSINGRRIETAFYMSLDGDDRLLIRVESLIGYQSRTLFICELISTICEALSSQISPTNMPGLTKEIAEHLQSYLATIANEFGAETKSKTIGSN